MFLKESHICYLLFFFIWGLEPEAKAPHMQSNFSVTVPQPDLGGSFGCF